jgi:hypothetical protein
MTMHLARGLTLINTTKRKKKRKITKNQMENYEKRWREHNKHMRQQHLHKHQLTLKEYIDYCHGEYKSKVKTEAIMNTPWHHVEGTYRRETPEYKSLSTENSFSPCTKKEPMVYTGERKLIGIATMHKSNMVPVFADDDDKTGKRQATEIAKMRRN